MFSGKQWDWTCEIFATCTDGRSLLSLIRDASPASLFSFFFVGCFVTMGYVSGKWANVRTSSQQGLFFACFFVTFFSLCSCHVDRQYLPCPCPDLFRGRTVWLIFLRACHAPSCRTPLLPFVVVFTLNRSFYPTTSAVPPVSFVILHPRGIQIMWSQWDRKTKRWRCKVRRQIGC